MKKVITFALVLLCSVVCSQNVVQAGIVNTGLNTYIINVNARTAGWPGLGGTAELLDVSPGLWRITPVNYNIDPHATYMSWSFYASGGGWTTLLLVQDIAVVPLQNMVPGSLYYGKGAYPDLYQTAESAFYDDPLNIPLEILVTTDSTLAFWTPDSYSGDNRGGVSVRVELIPEPATMLLLGLGGLALRRKRRV